MLDYALSVYNDPNPDNKDKEWASKVLTVFRTYWKPLVGQLRAVKNREVMYGLNSIKKIEDSFQDEDFKKATTFKPIPYLEAFVNTVVEEIVQNPPRTEVRAQDPLSVIEKEEDIKLLRSRKILERDKTTVQRSVGSLPPDGQYKIPYDEFSGNVQEFDEMGLDENDDEDVTIYRTHFQKLWYEIGAQAALNAILKNTEFDEFTIRRMVKDIFSFKACSTQAYVDQVTGEIKYQYIDPSTIWGLFGATTDGKKDVCRGWYRQVTLMEWMSMVGEEFDFDQDWKKILWGINYCNTQSYTGFIRGGKTYSCLGDSDFCSVNKINTIHGDNLLMWDNAYMFKLNVGYAEWPTWIATSSFRKKGDEVYSVPYSYEITDDEKKDGYFKEDRIQQQWYRAYFLATSTVTQYVYGFQKIFFQTLEGANDEYSNGTLCYWQEEGQSAVELSETFMEIGNFAYYRFLWLIYHTKPLAEEYVLDEIITLAKAIQRESPQNAATNTLPGFDTVVKQIIEQQRRGHYRLRVFPTVDGKKIAQLPPDGRKQGDGGVDPTALVMQSVSEWVEARISKTIGINPMRLGANPPSRESLKTEENTVNASMNATGYIYRMVQYVMKHQAVAALNYISDIIQYPDTIPYRWLEKLLGERTFGYLKSLKKDTPHRVGVFISDINLAAIKQRTMQAADMALSKGTITLSQWNILFYMEDPKMANARLEIMQRQAEKKARRMALELEQAKTQGALQIESAKQQTEGIKANALVQSAQIGAGAQVESARIQSDGRLQVKQMQVQAEPEKQEAKGRKDKELMQEEYNLKNQQPLTGSSEE